MFDLAILDVVIGVAFVFMVVSTLCAAIREGIEGWMKTRSSYLEYGIRELLHDRAGAGLAKSLYSHPLIAGLYQGDYEVDPADQDRRKPALSGRKRKLPSYISARTFAQTLMDIAARGPTLDAASSDPGRGKITFGSLRASVGNLQNPHVQRIMLSAFDNAEDDLESVRLNLESWYNDGMDRVSGWYKRTTQWLVLGIAVAVVSALNINTFVIVHHLYRDETLRSALVSAAERAVVAREDEGAPPENEEQPAPSAYETASATLQGLGLPIGWERGWKVEPSRKHGPWNSFFGPVLGLLITALAAMLGAPFWFDVLNKVMVIRATVKPREKSQEEGSEDRASTTKASSTRQRKSESPPPPQPQEAAKPLAESKPGARALDEDDDDLREGCDHDEDPAAGAGFTKDDELPAAEGGVA